MRTSRIARETSKVSQTIRARVSEKSATAGKTTRQTRSFANQLSRYASRDPHAASKIKIETEGKEEVKEEKEGSKSSLRSPSSTSTEDNEATVPAAISASSVSLKRKRGVDAPPTPLTTPSTVSRAQSSVRGGEGEDEKTLPRRSSGRPNRVPARERRPARNVTRADGEVEVQAPLYWEEVYETVTEMRKHLLAPVDTMGCETLAQENISPRDKRFQTLIALMLSSQTKDTTTAAAIRALQTTLPAPGLTLENILAVEPTQLNQLIGSVGFHNIKTGNIKRVATILATGHSSDIPSTLSGLLALPGVGPKMAHLCLSAAWGRTEGIGVDVHVHRITNLWGWHRTRDPEGTRAALESWLPREKWHEINRLLVGFGQTLCKPVKRECWRCDVGAKGLCPGMVRGSGPSPRTTKVKKEEAVVKEEMRMREEGEEEITTRMIKREEAEEAEPEIKMQDMEDIGPTLETSPTTAATEVTTKARRVSGRRRMVSR
ncbi:MAG: DNA N-glycosylase and apurinic/apyrimidinic (AP) lyase [Thelocarpon superellum]|nr:MAG: DNA N-glycosylase and apurinic/apyrimidinic (AP) lyase [Thelocarpon superellum]